jgi:hypothetical protein
MFKAFYVATVRLRLTCRLCNVRAAGIRIDDYLRNLSDTRVCARVVRYNAIKATNVPRARSPCDEMPWNVGPPCPLSLVLARKTEGNAGRRVDSSLLTRDNIF